MSKHTPGPWRVDPEQDIDVQAGDGEIEIAVALGSALSGKSLRFASVKMPPKKEALANARLIAAAPDMLAALKGCQALIKTNMSTLLKHDDPEPAKSRFLEFAQSVDTAIAKAEGQS